MSINLTVCNYIMKLLNHIQMSLKGCNIKGVNITNEVNPVLMKITI